MKRALLRWPTAAGKIRVCQGVIMTVAFITHRDCQLHDMGSFHPECPARLGAINDRLLSSGLDGLLVHHDAPMIDRDTLLLAHDAVYLDKVFAAAPAQGLVWLDGDTGMNPHTVQAAQRAAGAVRLAVDLVMEGRCSKAFCSIRPPGHHAERDKAMGFCFFNNIAVGAAYALEKLGLERIAVVDFDVHHGNGTEHILQRDPRSLFCSTYQHPFYPYSGHACDSPNVVNAPLPAGSDGTAFREAVREHWLPRLNKFKPQLIFVSAGFDAHAQDDIANLNLVEADYDWVTAELVKVADKYSEGRIVSSLEGGYATQALARSVDVHLRALMGQ
jgi:acetoin utilization deacetylase AcuC-like enzyme